MAPSKAGKDAAGTHPSGDASAPLADYFFICGIEPAQVFDVQAMPASPAPAEVTIEEDKELDMPLPSPGVPPEPSPRISRYSFEGRKSVGSIIYNIEPATPASTRSSVTIRQSKGEGHGLSDDAFEEALKKFASERDSFLEDIHVSAGTVTSSTAAKRPRPRTIRISTPDESVLKNSVGSIRRRLSTMKRPASVLSRASTRTARRVSGYNAVTPAPQPFHIEPGMHPLKRRYEPVLLDRYPTAAMSDELKRRTPFPDFVPMFTFPNDVNVVSSDERPRSTWHGFAMTGADSNKLYGICVILWVPLDTAASDALERQCENWRKANMTNEERELAASLGERLSAERAKLSRLLAELPTVPSGSDAREHLEDQISAVEEKIGLMADLLRPVRHGAATKIDGLTEGETGFWVPRAYGVLGRDGHLTSFWKEWLKAVVVPMTNGSVLRVPASSPKVGLWQPLERYVCNLCVEAPSPITSMTQVEISIRDLRLYARREAVNEIPGSRNTDLYALFRCLTVPNVITLFEYALSESRVILLSSHTAMLHLACSALTSLLYPLQWTGILIPVLPSRLLTTLEAPCPYIAGVERRFEKLELPDDDFCLVDLDENTIESTGPPIMLPRPQRRKLMSLLQAAAPHHTRFGVPIGPPQHAIETFPYDAFSSESPQIFCSKPATSTLSNYVSESSTTFGQASSVPTPKTNIFNAFLQNRSDGAKGADRPSTSSTGANSQSSTASPPSPTASPTSHTFPTTPVSRNDSGLALQTSLREKRSGHLNDMARRNSGVLHVNRLRDPFSSSNNEPSQQYGNRRPNPFGHYSSPSTSTLPNLSSSYAPSVYAQSTLAASTIMQQTPVQQVRDTENTQWAEGHCFQRQNADGRALCAICDEKCDDEVFKCSGCGAVAHGRCTAAVCLVCPVAFRADQVRAAFVRCFASLFYTYRRYMQPATSDGKKAGMKYHFNMDQFLKSVPHGDSEYMHMLRQTQSFNEFIHEREVLHADADPAVQLFDEIILSKRNRGPKSLFSKSNTSFLSDKADHLWHTAAATPPASSSNRVPGGDLRAAAATTARTPAKLDVTLMKEPRAISGVPRAGQARTQRKPVPSMLGLAAQSVGK